MDNELNSINQNSEGTANSEAPKEADVNVEIPDGEPKTVQQESTENKADVDIELDPDISTVVEEPVKNASGFTMPQAESQSEPIAPVMPVIPRNEYVPADNKKGSNGVKVFAVVVAILIVMCGCVTGGYFLGIGSGNSIGGSTAKIDLASKPQSKDAKSISQVYSEVNASIVGIYVYNSSGVAGSATGVVYSNGYIITNDHIYEGTANAKFKIYTHDGKQYDASYVAGDTRSDLAVLKTSATGLKAATFGNSDELAMGETVVAIGCPNGADEAASISEGCISALNRRLSSTSNYSCKFIQTDSAINPGNSGGALCNLYGQVVGITSAKLAGTAYDNVGFAIPTSKMKTIVDSLISKGYVAGRAKLGISYYNVSALAAEIQKIPTGLQIANIDESSSLYKKANVKDYITKVNGKEITSSDILLDIIESHKAGDTITLTVISSTDGKSTDYTVKLIEDKGSSSYNNASSSSQSGNSGNSSSGGGNNDNYNSSQFSFPNGD